MTTTSHLPTTEPMATGSASTARSAPVPSPHDGSPSPVPARSLRLRPLLTSHQRKQRVAFYEPYGKDGPRIVRRSFDQRRVHDRMYAGEWWIETAKGRDIAGPFNGYTSAKVRLGCLRAEGMA